MQVVLDGVDGFVEADDPALVIEYQVDVDGDRKDSEKSNRTSSGGY